MNVYLQTIMIQITLYMMPSIIYVMLKSIPKFFTITKLAYRHSSSLMSRSQSPEFILL